MTPTVLLLAPKIMSIRNSLTLKAVLKRMPFLLIGLLLWIGFYEGTYRVLDFVRGIPFFGEILSRKLLSVTFFGLSIFLILSNVITALSAFYISRDLPLLMSSPVKVRHIIRLKTIETMTNSSWMVFSFMPPFFIAYGLNYRAPVIFYLVLIFTFVPFVLISGGLGIILSHLLTRIFSAKRMRMLFFAAGLMLFMAVYLLFRSRWSAGTEGDEQFFLSFLKIRTDSHFLPGFWMTESLMPVLRGESPGVLYPLLSVGAGAILLVISAVSGRMLYERNLERIVPSSLPMIRISSGSYPAKFIAFWWKDLRIFFRDPGQWSQLFIIGALILIYVYNFRALPADTLSDAFPFMKEFLVLINMLMAGLVLSAVASRFLYSSVSLEGMAFWIIRTSPVTVKSLLISKFLFGFLPVTGVLFAVVIIANAAIRIDAFLSILSAATTLLLCISISGLGIGMGAMYPKFKHENVAAISMGPGGMFFMLVAFLVVLLTVAIEAYCFFVYRRTILMEAEIGIPEKVQFLLGGVSALLINAAAFYIPLKLGMKYLEQDLSL